MLDENALHFQHRTRMTVNLDMVFWNNRFRNHVVQVSTLVLHHAIASCGNATDDLVLRENANHIVIGHGARAVRSQHGREDWRVRIQRLNAVVDSQNAIVPQFGVLLDESLCCLDECLWKPNNFSC